MNRLGVVPNLRTFAIFILLALLLVAPSCNWFRDFDFARGARMTGGNPELGRKKLGRYSYISCHAIPGVPKGEGKSAPSLANWSGPQIFLNTFPNTPENLEKAINRLYGDHGAEVGKEYSSTDNDGARGAVHTRRSRRER